MTVVLILTSNLIQSNIARPMASQSRKKTSAYIDPRIALMQRRGLLPVTLCQTFFQKINSLV